MLHTHTHTRTHTRIHVGMRRAIVCLGTCLLSPILGLLLSDDDLGNSTNHSLSETLFRKYNNQLHVQCKRCKGMRTELSWFDMWMEPENHVAWRRRVSRVVPTDSIVWSIQYSGSTMSRNQTQTETQRLYHGAHLVSLLNLGIPDVYPKSTYDTQSKIRLSMAVSLEAQFVLFSKTSPRFRSLTFNKKNHWYYHLRVKDLFH